MLSSKRLLLIVAAAILVPIAGFAWWLGSPLLFDEVVEEAFPLAASASLPPGTTREEVEKKSAVPQDSMRQPRSEQRLVSGQQHRTLLCLMVVLRPKQ